VRSTFDRRVVSDTVLEVIRACQRRAPCHLGGGAALSGAYLSHRLSGDVDLMCHQPSDVRLLTAELPAIARETGTRIALLRDSGPFVRASLQAGSQTLDLDLVHEAVPDLESAPSSIEGVVVESLADLRASKITCILSRSEPRDLVDLLFLERAGYPPERDLPLALKKDAGIDPGVLAWLLGQFPIEPMPVMLQPLSVDELMSFRNDLRERFKRAAVPGP
jgi:Nucleotidyl transferase AbiEii toxin, Type IV TA system